MVLLSVPVVLKCLFSLFYIIKKQSCFMYISKTEFSWLRCYILSILLGGIVMYSFDSSTISYCMTIPFPPSKKGTWVASRFCYYKQCCWDLFVNMSPTEHWTLHLCFPPPHTPAHSENHFSCIYLGWNSRDFHRSHRQAIWKSNMTPWEERENVSKWRENNGDHKQK